MTDAQAAVDSNGISIDAQLDALRRESAWRLDPVRFRYLEAMARRLADQGAPVRGLLEAKLAQAMADYVRRIEAAKAASPEAQPFARRTVSRTAPRTASRDAAAPETCQPLAQLNAYIRSVSQDAGSRPKGESAGPEERTELASARRFRQAWTRQRAQTEVASATVRKPANAGPLNSHALALQSLTLMQSLSPDYLRRFLLHVESLQWLDQAGLQYPATQARGGVGSKAAKAPARRSRARK